MTNYERIKNMSIDEMIELLPNGTNSCDDCIVPTYFCARFISEVCDKNCPDEECHIKNCKYNDCKYKMRLWLENEVENVKNK